MEPLSRQDALHLQAAQGWLDLGNHREANEELEKITATHRSHPDVLAVRWLILAKARNWEACYEIANALIKIVPDRADNWIHCAFALHEMKRTQEAWDILSVLLTVWAMSPRWRITWPVTLASWATGKLR